MDIVLVLKTEFFSGYMGIISLLRVNAVVIIQIKFSPLHSNFCSCHMEFVIVLGFEYFSDYMNLIKVLGREFCSGYMNIFVRVNSGDIILVPWNEFCSYWTIFQSSKYNMYSISVGSSVVTISSLF